MSIDNKIILQYLTSIPEKHFQITRNSFQILDNSFQITRIVNSYKSNNIYNHGDGKLTVNIIFNAKRLNYLRITLRSTTRQRSSFSQSLFSIVLEVIGNVISQENNKIYPGRKSEIKTVFTCRLHDCLYRKSGGI